MYYTPVFSSRIQLINEMTITTQSDTFVFFSIKWTPTVNDLLKARGIYLIILGVQEGCLTDSKY